MELVSAKILSVVLLWLTTFLFGFLPLVVSRIIKRKKQKSDEDRLELQSASLLDHLNFIAGGVFLATIFLDLLPEATKTLAKAIKKNHMTVNVPMTPLIMAIGMLLFMHFEHLTLMLKDYWNSVGRGRGMMNMKAICERKDDEVELFSIKDSRRDDLDNGVDDSNTKPKKTTSMTFYGPVVDSEETESGALLEKDLTKDFDPGHFDQSGDHVPPPPTDVALSIEKSGETVVSHSSSASSGVNSPLRSYILVTALSLHSVFDGIVIGLSSRTSDVWTLFTAVVFHKSLVSLSLGSKLLKMAHCITKRTIFFLILTFTLTTPTGGTIGILMTSMGHKDAAGGLAEGVLISMATGTFMYVTFFEMLKFEGDNKSNLINTVLVAVGFAITATGISFQGDPAEAGELQTISRP